MSIAEVEPEKSAYLDALDALAAQDGPRWLTNARAAWRGRFIATPLPSRKTEAWRFTNLAPILRGDFTPHINHAPVDTRDAVLPAWMDPDSPRMVFVDGAPALDLCHGLDNLQGIEIEFMNPMDWRANRLAPEVFGTTGDTMGSAFESLNRAMLDGGAVIRVADRAVLEEPMQVMHIVTTAAQGKALFPRLYFAAGLRSDVTLVESFTGPESAARYYSNALTEISAGEGARVRYARVLHPGAEARHTGVVRARLAGGAVLETHAHALSGLLTRTELAVSLDGEGAECSLHGLYLAAVEDTVDNYVSVAHHAPGCKSWIAYKGVLDGASQGLFTGKVHVDRAAQKTDSQQVNKSMLLSDKATMNTRPVLEIFADDVRCTHGATVGLPPGEQVFYFQTRGIDPERARGLLTYGFADEIAAKAPADGLRAWLDRHIYNRYCAKEA